MKQIKMTSSRLLTITMILTIAHLTEGYFYTPYSYETNSTKPKIHIGGLIPYYWSSDEFCFYSAMSVAIDIINKDDRLLKDHDLVLHPGDTYTSPGFAYDAYYKIIYENNFTMQAIIGPGFSRATAAIASFTNRYKLPQVSFTALNLLSWDSDPEKKTFPYFLRTTPSLSSYYTAFGKIFSQFKWKRFAIIYEFNNQHIFKAAYELSNYLEDLGINTVEIQGFSDEYSVKVQFDKLQAADATVIIGISSKHGTRGLFCEAHHRGMVHPKYQWLILYTPDEKWYENVRYSEPHDCKREDLLAASDGFISLARSPLRTDKEKSFSKLTAEEAWERIRVFKKTLWDHYYLVKRNESKPMPDKQYHINSMFAFDAVYVVAIGFDRAIKKYGPGILTNKYYDEHKARILTNEMLKSDFKGVTGDLLYDRANENERLGDLIVKQFRRVVTHYGDDYSNATGKYKDIGVYQGGDRQLVLFQEPYMLYSNLQVNRDVSVIYIDKVRLHSVPVISTLWGGAVLGILFSLCLLFINLKFRNIRLIKMSSPNINNGIITGCIISYTTVILYGIDTRFVSKAGMEIACNAVAMTLSVGFTLMFGCLFSKTWRIYRIFTAAKTMERVAIKDSYLFVVIVLLLAIDIFVFVIWVAISPFTVIKEVMETIKYPGIVKTIFVHRCTCENQLHFTIALYVYKGILLIIGLFLAWETRKVKVPVLNDSKFIGMAVYNVCVISAVGVICATALNANQDYTTGYIVFALCIFISTTGTLLIVFIPKILMLFGKSSDERFGSVKVRTDLYSNSSTSRATRSTQKFMQDRYSINESPSNSQTDGSEHYPIKFLRSVSMSTPRK